MAETLFGYSKDELSKLSVEDLVPMPIQARHKQDRANYLKSPEARPMGKGKDLFARHKNDHLIPVEIGLSPIPTPLGTFVIRAIFNLTERRQSQKAADEASTEIKKRIQDLERSNRELEDFAHIVSHDLKEALRGISHLATFTLEDYKDKFPDEAKQNLTKITKLCIRMDEILESLLQCSKLGQVDLFVEIVPLEEIVSRAFERVRIQPPEGEWVLSTGGKLPRIKCDRVRIEEVFYNLLSNAFKYNQQSVRKVEVSCVPNVEEKSFVISIRDNGIGIPERQRDLVFKPLRRIHGREKCRGVSGVGLTIVEGLLERQGGKIWIESNEGEGATFCIKLEDQNAQTEPR